MPDFRPLLALLGNEARRLRRDRFLLGTAAYIVSISIAMRWILPWASRALAGRWGIEIEPHYPVIVSYLLLVLGAVMVGMIAGFLLLESREEGSIRALLVSPMRLDAYLAAASVVMALIAGGVTVAEGALIGLALPPWPAFVPIALVGGLGAPIFALFLATFAANKVEAFVQMKFVGLGGLVPVGAAFLPESWQYAACLFPPFWAAKAWWVAAAGGAGWAWWLLGGAVTSLATLWALVARFRAVAPR